MSGELLSPITDALKPAGKKRGRKPGGGKVPGSGRKAGGANKVPKSLKDIILTRGRPIELLCDISRGVKIRVGPQAGPGEAAYAYPTLQERAAAAKILIDKLVSAAPATPDAGTPSAAAPAMSDKELANLMAFTLQRGLNATDPAGAPARMVAHREEQIRKVSEASLRTVIIDQPKRDPTPRPMPSPSPPPDKAWAARVEMDAAPWRSADYTPSTAPTTIRHRPKG